MHITKKKNLLAALRFYAGILLFGGCLQLLTLAFAYANEGLKGFENEPIQPIEYPAALDLDKVRLGEKLFNDVRLSRDNSMSCATCHQVDQGGALNTQLAPPGVSGKGVPINVPTILGSGLNFSQFWDGRSSTLEDQLDGPTANPDEMGSSWPEIMEKLVAEKDYVEQFNKVYGAPPTVETVKNAIATFERAQVPVDSPFDKYLRGDEAAISIPARKGYELFKTLGCASCHQGQNVGGNMFQKFGIIEDYFHDRGNVIEKDYGRFNVTHLEEDKHVFKVPSLRNIELTAPYFHDGSAKTLNDAVNVMAKYQLGRTLSVQEQNELVAFLKSLTGTIPPLVKEGGDE